MNKRLCVFVGTYTEPIRFGTGEIMKGRGEGIYRCELDLQTGELVLADKTAGVSNPSYLTLDVSKKYLYAVNELKEFEGRASGAVSAFSVEPGTHKLAFLNQRATNGADPCHVAVNGNNTHVFVSNYSGGSVCVFPRREDGSLAEASHFIQHSGSSVHPVRQSGPHAHSLVFDPGNSYAFVADLGLDRLMIYKTDFAKGRLEPAASPYLPSEPGAGPRFCVFHPAGGYCYVINELNSTISALRYDRNTGVPEVIQVVPTVPGKASAENTGADILITPDGQYLYASNRGDDSIAIYKINRLDGSLAYAGTEPSGGRTPRNFAVDPTGAYLLVGNQDSDNIVVFAINRQSGALKRVSEASVPAPVCIKPYFMD